MLRKILGLLKGSGSAAKKGAEEPRTQQLPAKLDKDKLGSPADHSLKVATAVLLIEMAASDSEIASEEAEMVCAVLEKQFQLEESKIPSLVQDAIEAKRTTGKIHDFVSLINERFTEKQRQVIMGMIWRIVLADGKIEKSEETMAQQMQTKLRLTDEVGREARKFAEQGLV